LSIVYLYILFSVVYFLVLDCFFI